MLDQVQKRIMMNEAAEYMGHHLYSYIGKTLQVNNIMHGRYI
jgi:hypothetical protein